jgi:hypothetical protein
MNIRVGSQHGGIINNVEGSQVNYGGQYGSLVTAEEAGRAVRDLRDALAGLPLDGTTAAAARAQVAEIDAAVRGPTPDKPRTASTLGRLIRLLTDAGSLATAGAALVGPLQALAGWLGPHGAALLALLA